MKGFVTTLCKFRVAQRSVVVIGIWLVTLPRDKIVTRFVIDSVTYSMTISSAVVGSEATR